MRSHFEKLIENFELKMVGGAPPIDTPTRSNKHHTYYLGSQGIVEHVNITMDLNELLTATKEVERRQLRLNETHICWSPTA